MTPNRTQLYLDAINYDDLTLNGLLFFFFCLSVCLSIDHRPSLPGPPHRLPDDHVKELFGKWIAVVVEFGSIKNCRNVLSLRINMFYWTVRSAQHHRWIQRPSSACAGEIDGRTSFIDRSSLIVWKTSFFAVDWMWFFFRNEFQELE